MKKKQKIKFRSVLAIAPLFLASTCVSAADLPYSNDLKSNMDDWTFFGGVHTNTENGLQFPNGNGAGAYVTDTTGWSGDVATTVRINFSEPRVANPMILGRVSGSNTFYMYRFYPDANPYSQLYNFTNGTYESPKANLNLTFDNSIPTMYYRMNTLTADGKDYVVAETSQYADFSVLNDRMEMTYDTVKTGTSAGLRVYDNATAYRFSDFSVQNLTAWTNTAGGDWDTATNWSNQAIPNSAGAVADFSMLDPTAAVTVTNATAKTVGRMIFGDMAGNTNWTLAGAGEITLDSGDANNKAVITVEAGSKATINNKINSTGAVALNGGGTLAITDASGVTGGWYITNATLKNADGLAAGDMKLGSGTITLAGGATLSSDGSVRRNVTNDIVFSGENTVYSQGLFLLGTLSGNGIIHKQGGWDMTVSGNNPRLSADWYVENDYVRFNSGNAPGTGAIHYAGGAVLAGADNLTFSNDLYIDTNVNNYLFGAQTTVTLSGKIIGDKNITLNSNQYKGTTNVNLRGDASAFTGNWTINETQSNNAYAPTVVSTDNTSNVKVNGGDSRFGAGSISLGRGALKADAASTYIHNNIALMSNSLETPFQFDDAENGKVLTLTGNLTGNSDITLHHTNAASSTANRLRLLDGDNSGFSGDWHLKNVFLVTNATDVQNKAFGSGKIYLEGGAGIVGWSGTSTASTYNSSRADAFVYNNIDVAGVNYFRSDGDKIGSDVPNFQLTVRGNITGDADAVLVRQGGGFRFTLRGDNTGYAGDWIIRSDYVDTDNTSAKEGNSVATHTDLRFGSGTIYLTGGAGIQGSNSPAVFADITVNAGQTGNFRNNNFGFHGTVSVDGTLGTDTTNVRTANIYGTLQGTGTVNAPVTMMEGSTLNPGRIGVSEYNYSTYAKSPLDDIHVSPLTFGHGLTMNEGSILNIDLASASAYDKVNVTGDLTMNGTIDLNFLDGFDASGITFGQTFDIFTVGGTISTQNVKLNYDLSQIAGLYEGVEFMPYVTENVIGIRAGIGANYVPEPATWVLLVLGVGVMFMRRKK